VSDEGTALASRGGEWASEVAFRAIERASDEWWDLQGGPWCAQYHHFASLTAIGVFEGEPHRDHFMDPKLALEHFQGPKFDRWRRDVTLRRSCLIVFKDSWYCVEPFADDAAHAVEVMRDEVARDLGRGSGSDRGKRWAVKHGDGGEEGGGSGQSFATGDAGGSA
jgi:hypothetical protein